MEHTPKYLSLDELTALMSQPNRSCARRFLEDNKEILKTALGGRHNHHAWEGGYLDHVTECMNFAALLYPALSVARPQSFRLDDALTVLFLHDIEKPWRYEKRDGVYVQAQSLDSFEKREAFTNEVARSYGFVLSIDQHNALRFVEGENQFTGYSPSNRGMGRLAAFCHMCDVWSARGAYDHPLADEDPWPGAFTNRPK